MADAIRASDGSVSKEPLLESPFPAGAPPHIQGEGPQSDYGKNVADMAERFEKQRQEDHEAVVAEDPGAAAMHAQAEAEQRAASKKVTKEQAEKAEAEAKALGLDGAASRAPLHEDQPEVKPELPEEVKDDPLAEHIIMQDGRPMVKLKIDGEDQLVDLDKVRANAQKDGAADRRLQYAAELNKSLTVREVQLKRDEEALTARISGGENGPPSNADAGNVDFVERSKEYTHMVFSGDEEEAAAYQAETYKLMRQVSTPQIDIDRRIDEKFAVVEQRAAKARYDADLDSGYRTFSEMFPEIKKGSKMFISADHFSDDVIKEHPEWTPSEVMVEAGKRTREQVAGLREEALADLPKSPADASRQAEKDKLQHIPRPQTGRQEQEPTERPQTNSEILAETRKARGQPD